MVSHNRAALLRRCLEALEHSEDRASFHVILLDNGSTDDSTALEPEFPEIRFMRLPRNFGLTKALNIGIRSAEADYLFLLHDDAAVSPGAIRDLTAALDANPDAGAVCPLLVDDDGSPAPQAGDFPPDGVYESVPAGPDPVEVDYASGAALMFRIFFFKAMRQIDERYGQFGSDAELCFQIRRSGKKILVLPGARAVHHGREWTSTVREADFLLGAALFSGKHYGFLAGLKVRLGAIGGALVHFRFGELFALISGQKLDGTQS